MSHKLDDITLYYYPNGKDALLFTKRHNVVSGSYVHFLDGYKPKGTSRISAELSSEDEIKGNHETSILGVTVQFDKDKYWSLSENDQNKYILDTIHRIALVCANEYNWDKTIFEAAYKKVIDTNFLFEFELKRKFSRSRKNKASILVSTNIEYTSLIAVFYDKNESEINRVELLKTYQHEMFYGELIRNYKWHGTEEFGIQSKHGEIIIKCGIDSTEPNIIITPSDIMSREITEDYLKTINYIDENECV